MDDIQLEELHKLELEILDEVIRICNKYNITYYAIAGTCLGAVRHKGFIPWDDDIDIAIPRSEYEYFTLCCKKDLDTTNYFYQDYKTDKEYYQNFSKIRMNNTRYVEEKTRNVSMHQGVFIDVFPLEEVENNIYNIFLLKLCRVLNKVNILFRNPFFLSDKKQIYFKKIIYFIFENKINKLIDWIFNNKVKYGNYYVDTDFKIEHKRMMDRKIFGSGQQMTFENLKIIVPENYKQYLFINYGEYMTLPPIENRILTHIPIEFKGRSTNNV